MLRQLPVGISEVAVHPAIVDDGLRNYGGAYIDERADELAVVLDPRYGLPSPKKTFSWRRFVFCQAVDRIEETRSATVGGVPVLIL